MIYKIADSYLTNTDVFLNSDDTTYCELRKSPNNSVGIVGTFNATDFTYDFDVTEDGYYKLFTFTNKIKSTDLINGEVVTTYEKGNIQEEPLFQESYIDIKQTGSPKIYKALISQTSEDAPTAVTLENTLGTFTFIRDSTGCYFIQSTEGLFTDGKTFILPNTGMIQKAEEFYNIFIEYTDVNNIKILVLSHRDGTPTDSILLDYPILIEVYP